MPIFYPSLAIHNRVSLQSGLEHRTKVLVVYSSECGSVPGRDTCVPEQDALLHLLLFTQRYKWVLARVEVDTVYTKATGVPRQLRVVYSPGS